MTEDRRQITLPDFLTDSELTQAAGLQSRVAVRDQIIVPHLERINAAIGQENDPDYLAYMVEYVMRKVGTWP